MASIRYSKRELKLDGYKLAAMEMFHVAYGQVTDAQRRTAKEMLFVYAYGSVSNSIEYIVTDSRIKTDN